MVRHEVSIATLPGLPQWFVNMPLLLQVPLTLGMLFTAYLLSFAAYFLSIAFIRVVQVHILHSERYENVPRPKHSSSFWWPILGDIPDIRQAPPSEAHIRWARELDSDVYVYRALFYMPRLLVADPKALNHVLGQQHSYEYPKPESTRRFLDSLLGNGLLVSEGDVHRRQRKTIQPAFNVSAMRDLTPLFFRHANQFVAKLDKIIDATDGPAQQPFIEGQTVESARESQAKKPVLDISHWFGRLTLDIIGEAGFGHQFDAVKLDLDQQRDSIVSSFRQLMRLISSISFFQLLLIGISRMKGFAWVLDVPTKRRRVIKLARSSLDRTGKDIIDYKRREILAEMQASGAGSVNGEKDFFEEKAKSKDLLYLMMKANIAPGVRDSERMSDAELLGQITTLLTAGHETTSTLLTWFLYFMTQEKHHKVVARLRAEIEEYFAGRDELDYDALMAMPYLDNCTKEVLRLLSPVSNTERHVTHDDVIPLSKEHRSRDGKSTFNSVPVRKGQMLFIPIQAVNRSKAIWGPTADEFDPDRWDHIPQTAKDSGFPMHILSFLEGPRGCIGNRFAIAEFKAIACTILRSFQFEALDWEIERKQGIVVRPRVVGQEEHGTQFPLRVSRLHA